MMLSHSEITITKHYSLVIKAGERQFMEALVNKGHLHCKSFKYFREIELIHDKRKDTADGAYWISQMQKFELFLENKLLGRADSVQLNIFDEKNDGHIFCLSSVERPPLPISSDNPIHLTIKSSNFKFDEKTDTAVLITNFKEFADRIDKAVSLLDLRYDFKPILYYDKFQEEGELTPFMKSNKYQNENEIRFWFPGTDKNPLDLFIGDLSDICIIIPLEQLDHLHFKIIDT